VFCEDTRIDADAVAVAVSISRANLVALLTRKPFHPLLCVTILLNMSHKSYYLKSFNVHAKPKIFGDKKNFYYRS
jgi:hypothetical protein